nr:MAG TPA: hypothetical protein [Caudoviricetes sp.]
MYHLVNFFYFRYIHAYLFRLRCSLTSFKVFQQFNVSSS